VSDLLVITPLCEVEVVNALGLRLFRGEISHAQAHASARDLDKNILAGFYQLTPFPDSAFSQAKTMALTMTPTIGVRAADLLHVAAAIELGAETFYTFDRKQHKAAQAAGLRVNVL